jgi:hypothetical protein
MIVAVSIMGILLIGVTASLVVSEGGLRTIVSRNWPTVQGTIEGGDVWVVGAQRKSFRTKLKYTYSVNDQSWSGTDTQDFYDEQTASDYVESRRGASAEVRYNPRKPQHSILT